MQFIVIENFSEAVNRRGRLRAVRKAAFSSIRKANRMLPKKGHWDVPGGAHWPKTSTRMRNKEAERRQHTNRASRAMRIYVKKRKGSANYGVDTGYRSHSKHGYTKTTKYGGTSQRSRFYPAKIRKGKSGEVM